MPLHCFPVAACAGVSSREPHETSTGGAKGVAGTPRAATLFAAPGWSALVINATGKGRPLPALPTLDQGRFAPPPVAGLEALADTGLRTSVINTFVCNVKHVNDFSCEVDTKNVIGMTHGSVTVYGHNVMDVIAVPPAVPPSGPRTWLAAAGRALCWLLAADARLPAMPRWLLAALCAQYPGPGSAWLVTRGWQPPCSQRRRDYGRAH